jgi:WD40 repeat protein
MKILFTSFTVCCLGAIASSAPPPPVSAVAYHPGGKLLAAGTYREVVLIGPAKGDVLGTIPGQSSRVTAVAFNKTGDLLAVASGEPGKSGEIRIYAIKDAGAKLEKALPTAHKDVIYALVFSPDGSLLASAGYDRLIKLWNLETDSGPRVLADHSDTIYGLSFHPEGKLLASAAADRAVKVWDVASGKRLYTLSDPTDWVYTVAWSPDGVHLTAAGIDKSIRIWEATASGGKLVHAVFAHTQPVTRIVYANDGKTLYSISEGKNIKSWDTATMKEKFIHPPQDETMLCIALSPDQKQLAVGRFDGALVLLNSENGKTMSQPLPAKPKPPLLQKLTPGGGLRGKTVHIAFEGKDLSEVDSISADDGRLTAKFLPAGRTATRIEADLAIPADAGPGIVKLSLKSAVGTSAALPFVVDRYLAITESLSGDSPRLGMKVTLPTTLVGSIGKAGDADYFRFEAKRAQEIAVQVLTMGSKLEPIVELTDATGKVLAESANGLLGYVCPTAGAYSLGIRDKDFRGEPDFAYRISVGGFPLVDGVFPLGVQRGKTSEVKLSGVNLDNRTVVPLTVPTDAVVGSKLDVPLVSLAEKPVGKATVVVGEFPETIVAEKNIVSVPGTANGIITKASKTQSIAFHATKGERLVVEVEARRLGSPLDSVIEICDMQGKPVQQATLRSVARTFSTLRDHDASSSGIRLESWAEFALDDYLFADGELMRINSMPRNVDDDCLFYQVAGQRVGFLGTTPTFHALASPMYKVEIHPPGTTFAPNGLPVFNLPYRNDDGGPGYGKDSRLLFDPPTDGEYLVRIGDASGQAGEHFAYRLTVRHPRPDFSVKFDPVAPSVWKGASVPVNATATRLDGYEGPIHIKLENLPPGFEAPPTIIEAGQTTATFPLYAAATAKVPEKAAPLKLVATAEIDGKAISHQAEGSQPKLLETGDLVTTTNVQEVSLTPGQSTKMLVSIERRNGFNRRVPIDVRGLPRGVRVLNIGLNGILITERDTQREIVLYADPWVQPMERPMIVVASQEGKSPEHGAKAVLLKVK